MLIIISTRRLYSAEEAL